MSLGRQFVPLAAAASLLLAGLTPLSAAQAQDKIAPVSPQPAEGAVQPGLSVLYYFHMFRHVDELIDWQDYRDGKPGPVIERLNYQVGQGDVLTSGVENGVGAQITGLINLDKPGTYAFAMESNDGVRLTIGGTMVTEDPGVHADQFSPIGEIVVETPGWHAFEMLYFERKNTSTLKLHWRTPGDPPGTMPLVPAAALGHLPQG